MQITQATITPTCRKKGDEVALDEALKEIRYKILMAMAAKPYNDNSTFQIVATLIREDYDRERKDS